MSSRQTEATGTHEHAATPVRVIIADDDPYTRRGVRDALQAAGVVVIAEAANGPDAIQLSVHYRPDVVLMDVVMPGMDGITATRELLQRAPEVKVLMLSADGSDDVALFCLRSGAAGFLSKSMDIASLPRVLAAVRNGEPVISPQLTARLIADMRRRPIDGIGTRPVVSSLTPREWEVLDLLCTHATTEQMADQLFLSTETVRSHIKNILRKLAVTSRQGAVDSAQRLRSDSVSVVPAVV